MASTVTIPKLWPGETVVCVGSGPSLTKADLELCRGRARVIVVNDAFRLAPWADCLYACDARWWKRSKDAMAFAGLKYSMVPNHHKGVTIVRNLGRTGLSLDRSGLKNGYNSGYAAIGLAVLFGAERVALLGYDMQGDHFFGSHPDKTKPPFDRCLAAFKTLIEPLAKAGVEIINCTRSTRLACFPCKPLETVLADVPAYEAVG